MAFWVVAILALLLFLAANSSTTEGYTSYPWRWYYPWGRGYGYGWRRGYPYWRHYRRYPFWGSRYYGLPYYRTSYWW